MRCRGARGRVRAMAVKVVAVSVAPQRKGPPQSSAGVQGRLLIAEPQQLRTMSNTVLKL